jgi:hypothetical protein
MGCNLMMNLRLRWSGIDRRVVVALVRELRSIINTLRKIQFVTIIPDVEDTSLYCYTAHDSLFEDIDAL